jgi:hypothetical protein
MFKATVNKKSFSIEPTDEGFIIDGKEVAWDLKKIEDGYYHILFNNKSFTAELVKADPEVKAFVFKINGRLYNVAVQDRFDLLLEQMGMNAGTHAGPHYRFKSEIWRCRKTGRYFADSRSHEDGEYHQVTR